VKENPLKWRGPRFDVVVELRCSGSDGRCRALVGRVIRVDGGLVLEVAERVCTHKVSGMRFDKDALDLHVANYQRTRKTQQYALPLLDEWPGTANEEHEEQASEQDPASAWAWLKASGTRRSTEEFRAWYLNAVRPDYNDHGQVT
jgi:hypothetical protein